MNPSRTSKHVLAFLCPLLFWSTWVVAAPFESRFQRTPDRIWLGPELWANPLEDWQVRQGRLECTTTTPGRSVHVLTHQLAERSGGFRVAVRLGLIEGDAGSAGLSVGIHDEIVDYRGNCVWGKGVPAQISTRGQLLLADQTAKLSPGASLKDVTLRLDGQPAGGTYTLNLTAIDTPSGKTLGKATASVPADRLVGNIALTHNQDGPKRKTTARFWFNDWTIEGDKVQDEPSHRFGPILWAMHTLSHSRGPEGYVLRISAQMPPLGPQDSQTVALEVREGAGWKSLARQPIEADARIALFRVPHWPADRDVPYRLVYQLKNTDGSSEPCEWTGTIRRDPIGRPVVIAGMTCQFHTAFPYAPVVRNLAAANPDLLYFSGDQIYESNGGFPIIREPADRAILNYLGKFYLFGWAFGPLMHDRPTVCLPDDHDVFHGNLWGEGGAKATGTNASTSGGYVQPVEMVNVVHRTNTAQNPDLFDPTPIQQGMSVYYGDMVYGRVSFAIVGDRQFKSGPGHVDTGAGRADWVEDPNADVSKLDKPGLELLGPRQMKFLEQWVADWRGADMKVLLSQTIFSNVATHHGQRNNFLLADLDSGGWPQSARNAAIRVIRKGFPLHINGDQHITSLQQYGVDQQRDANWAFCTPAISVGYQRWWLPDELGKPAVHRPPHGLPNTGEYLDGLGNRVYVYAIAIPTGSRDPHRSQPAEIQASGFSIVRVDCARRTYTCESYRFLADLAHPRPDNMFPGWPLTIQQREHYGRKPIGTLPEVSIEGVKDAVVQVYDQAGGELVYALRLQGTHVAPWVFAEGKYTVKIGDPDTGTWKALKDLAPTR